MNDQVNVVLCEFEQQRCCIVKDQVSVASRVRDGKGVMVQYCKLNAIVIGLCVLTLLSLNFSIEILDVKILYFASSSVEQDCEHWIRVKSKYRNVLARAADVAPENWTA